MKSRFLQALDAGERRTLVLYGTSLTAAAWAERLNEWLREHYSTRVRCVNSAMPGKASRTGLDELNERVLSHSPDCVFLEFAVNDATRVYLPSDRDFAIVRQESRTNLETLLDRIAAVRPNCECFLQTMNPAWDAPNGKQSASLRPELAAYYDGYRAVARARQLPLIDHYLVWRQLQVSDPARFQAYLPDGIHPETTGSEAVTWPGVQSALLNLSTALLTV